MKTKEIFSNKANDVLDDMQKILHPNTKEELEKNIEYVRDWLVKRLSNLSKQGVEEINLFTELNPWNEQGYGLQSVTIQAKDKEDNDLLLENECKHPTIGIITPGMLKEKGEYGITDFKIDKGKAEHVTSLSFDGITVGGVPIGSDLQQMPQPLRLGDMTEARGGEHVMRAFLELAKKDPNSPRIQIENTLKSGVYACEFLNLK